MGTIFGEFPFDSTIPGTAIKWFGRWSNVFGARGQFCLYIRPEPMQARRYIRHLYAPWGRKRADYCGARVLFCKDPQMVLFCGTESRLYVLCKYCFVLLHNRRAINQVDRCNKFLFYHYCKPPATFLFSRQEITTKAFLKETKESSIIAEGDTTESRQILAT